MTCLICESPTRFFFSKPCSQAPHAGLLAAVGIQTIDYHKCSACGFVTSETHRRLDPRSWQKLNYAFHQSLEMTPMADRLSNQPPYAEQALMVAALGKRGLIDATDMLDFAGGHGTLSGMLHDYFGLDLPIFEPYVTADEQNNRRYVEAENLQTYATVLNSAMFEHILTRGDLDQVTQLVKPNGALIIHTVVVEDVPQDPDWFYFQIPVHTAFHTNRSMEILMQQWGYASSLYSPKAKFWVLFKQPDDCVQEKVALLNREFQASWLFYKPGFVDYWK